VSLKQKKTKKIKTRGDWR